MPQPSPPPDAPASTEQLDSEDDPRCVSFSATNPFFPRVTDQSTTQVITTTSPDQHDGAHQVPLYSPTAWVCNMSHGKRATNTPARSTTITIFPNAHTQVKRNNSLSSSSTISSHEGSFYASLRVERNGYQEEQQQQQPPHRQRQRQHVQGALTASSTSAHIAGSDHTSETSFQADIINFGFTPSSASPTSCVANGQAWSISTGQTPSSPFTPFSPTAAPGQAASAPQQQRLPAYRSFRPSRLVPSNEHRQSPLTPSMQSTTSYESHTSCRSTKSASSSCPRTPQEFMVWRKELVEARTASESMRTRTEASSSCTTEPASNVHGRGRRSGPLHIDADSRRASRSCTGGAQEFSFLPPPMAAPGDVAQRSRSPLSAATTPRPPYHPQQHHRHHVPPSPHAGLVHPVNVFAQSATTPFECERRLLRPPLRLRVGNSPQLSRRSSFSNASSTAGAETPFARPSAAHRTIDGRDGRTPAAVVPQNRDGWTLYEQAALAVLVCGVVLYVLNRYLFIDIMSFFH